MPFEKSPESSDHFISFFLEVCYDSVRCQYNNIMVCFKQCFFFSDFLVNFVLVFFQGNFDHTIPMNLKRNETDWNKHLRHFTILLCMKCRVCKNFYFLIFLLVVVCWRSIRSNRTSPAKTANQAIERRPQKCHHFVTFLEHHQNPRRSTFGFWFIRFLLAFLIVVLFFFSSKKP